MALVKRLFPKLENEDLEKTIGWVPGKADRLAVGAWLSTRFMAALPWLQEAAKVEGGTLATAFKDAVEKHRSVTRPYRGAEDGTAARLGVDIRDFKGLDGSLFYDTAIINQRDMRLTGDEDGSVRSSLLQARADLIDAVNLGEPSPYYALLLMDGDSVGTLIRAVGADPVTTVFDRFTRAVPGLVKQNNGACIYAGGDDVLAVLPMTTALACVQAVRAGRCARLPPGWRGRMPIFWRRRAPSPQPSFSPRRRCRSAG